MLCHEFEERMQMLLDERRPAHLDPSLRAHASVCGDCHQNLRALEVLLRGLDRSQAPSRGFAERVVAQVGVVRRPWLLRSRALAVALAIAAVALVAVTVARFGPVNPPPQKADPAGLAKDPTLPPAADAQAPSLRQTRDIQAEKLAASNGSEQRLGQEQTASHRPDPEQLQQYSQAIQSLASQVPQAVGNIDVEEATPGLRPVRNSFSLAIGTIRRTMPPPRKAPPSRKPAKRDSSWSPASDSQPLV